MDNENNKPAPPPTRPGVMDIQRPSPAPQPPTAAAPSSPTPEPAVPPAETPVTPAVTSPVTPPVDDAQPAAENKPSVFDVAAAQAELDSSHPQSQHIDPKDPHAKADHLLAAHAQKKHHPIVPIVVAVLVALALAGAAVFAYMNSKDTTKGTGDHNTTTPHTEQSPAPATTQDIDDTSKEVDQTANDVNDAADMPETDLNDQNLGL